MGTSRDLLKRLEALNGGPLRYSPPAEPIAPPDKEEPPAIVYRREVQASRPALPLVTAGAATVLEEAIPGAETARAPHGTAYTITTELDAFGSHWLPLRTAFPDVVSGAALQARLLTRCRAEGIRAEELLFVTWRPPGWRIRRSSSSAP